MNSIKEFSSNTLCSDYKDDNNDDNDIVYKKITAI